MLLEVSQASAYRMMDRTKRCSCPPVSLKSIQQQKPSTYQDHAVPAGCPYGVTAVGGTQNQYPETAAGLSSGGFSNYFTAPDYQSAQTKQYIASIGNQYSGLYNPAGRGIPDVAAQAEL